MKGFARACVAVALAGPLSGMADVQGGFGGPEGCALNAGVDRAAPSSVCIECHDRSRGAFLPKHGGHPVDVTYGRSIVRASYRSGPSLRRNPQERVRNIVLQDGKITCLTCHDANSRLSFRLAAPMTGPLEQRLCEACHIVGD